MVQGSYSDTRIKYTAGTREHRGTAGTHTHTRFRKYLRTVMDSGIEADGNRLLRGLPRPGELASILGESRQQKVILGLKHNFSAHNTHR